MSSTHSDSVTRCVVSAALTLLIAAILLGGAAAPAQDTPAVEAPPAATEEAAAEASEAAEDVADTTTDSGADSSDNPVNDADENASDGGADAGTAEADIPLNSDPPATDPPATDTDVAADTQPDTAPADESAAEEASSGSGLLNALLVLATLIVPVVLGNWIANKIGMPDHAWKLATVLTTVAVGALAVSYAALNDGFKGGPDLSGGITLTYETEKGEAGESDIDPEAESRQVDMPQLVAAIKQRVDPAGTKEVTIRSSGADRIEVIVPDVPQDDLDLIKKRITDLGQLEFRILADPRWSEDDNLIKAGLALGPSQKLVRLGNQPAGRWAPVKGDEFRDDGSAVFRQAGKTREALVKLDLYNVTGDYLAKTAPGFGQSGAPIVEFTFDTKGANLFSRFTGENLASRTNPEVKRRLGILLDGILISAPNLNDRIRGRGEISGVGTEEDAKYLVSILNAGSLPASLNKNPLSEQYISPTIGTETVQKGTYAITVSLAAVLAFMLVYYRFAGLVACLALITNILLVLAVMVMINAAFTLPGLAGLVLTVGMSVDANVLIFERIREELNRGAALRMAIRNGFGRATTTIVDANITTLITGIVLYTIGTDQLRGFAVTLVLGILMSMYTAIFASRVVFDIAERRRWIKSLSFSSIVGKTNLDFIGKRGIALVVSLALIAVGLTAVVQRGAGLLSIDFNGGTSVTMVLADKESSSIADLRSTVSTIEEFGAGEFTVVEVGEDSGRFAIESAVEEVEEAESLLAEAFGDKLQTFTVTVGDAEPFSEAGADGFRLPLTFNDGPGFDAKDGLTRDGLLARVEAVAESLGKTGFEPTLANPDYIEGSNQRFKQWTLTALAVSADDLTAVAEGLKTELESQALFPVANKISGKVAGDLQLTATFAIVLSLLGIVGYLWFRFQNVSFGLAAVVALVHDVLVTLGAIA
ncbi:MAG: protein translocase subunit SecD, partial [Planctomycetota bacterium]